MKRVVFTAIVSIVLGLIIGWLVFRPSGSLPKAGERKIAYYRDPMNPQVTSPTPKKAPDGMDYVPVYEESGGQRGEKKIAYYKDPMHPWYTSDKPGKAPDCGMDLVPVYEGESDTKGIKIDPTTVQNIGVKVEDVVKRKLNKEIRTVGKVDFDERKLYSVNTKIMGWVEKLYVDYTGKAVRKGERLMELYSPELVSTQEEYLQALSYRKKLNEGAVDEARNQADELVNSARRRLLNWDIPESEIRALEQRGTPKKTMTIYSPADGIVMEKMVREGQNVMAGMELYKVADLSTVWILADIYQYDLPWVKVGQTAEITFDYLPGKSLKGKITYIYPYLNEDTKTAKVRIEVANTKTLDLMPDMFATVKIASPLSVEAIVAPDQAIIRTGERNIAVIALGGGYFEPRDVKLGVQSEGYVQILDGVRVGEKIVVSSQFLIDSESNLKAAISQMSARAVADSSGSMSEPAQSDRPTGVKSTPASHPGGKSGDLKKMNGKDMSGTEQPTEESQQTAVDPVCGMHAEKNDVLAAVFEGETYYFCSKEDMVKFQANPEKYAAPAR